MGRWGEGNFDDDLARDHLNNIIAGHEQYIERIFSGDTPEQLAKMDFFDMGESYLVPTVDIILALHKAFNSDYLPKPSVVLTWKNEYIKRINEILNDVLPDPGSQEWFQNDRRPVIESTFNNLLELSIELYKYTDESL